MGSDPMGGGMQFFKALYDFNRILTGLQADSGENAFALRLS